MNRDNIEWFRSGVRDLRATATTSGSTTSRGIAVPQHNKSCDRTETILLVEDDPAVREMTREALRKNGYQVFTADSDAQTLQVWERFGHQIDLLLADMLIPHRATGLELAKQLKREKPTLKVVFTSGFGREIGDRDPTFESASFLQKPYSPDALLRVISQCLEVDTEAVGHLN